jgi:hypothetical protein
VHCARQCDHLSAYFPKVSLCDPPPICVSVSPLPVSALECLNQSLWKLVYHGNWSHHNCILHKSLPSVCVCTCIPPVVARQRLGKHVPTATVEELLDASFSLRSVSYQKRVCGSVFVSPYRR